MLRPSASHLLGHVPSVSLAVDARWEFAGLAGLATRAALALVGDALAATHNPRALVPVILDVVTEATGARGARMLVDGEELGWVGEPGGGGNELRLDLSADDEATRTELVLYPPPEGFASETRQLAEWLAAQAGIALENARLHDLVQRQAITDDL